MKKILCGICLMLILPCISGCNEDKTANQSQTFAPIEPGERVQRCCLITSLDSASGELTPMEQIQDQAKDKFNVVEAKKEVSDNAGEKSKLPPAVEKYMSLQKSIPPQVFQAMQKANIRNYSVFLTQLEQNYVAIRYFDYIGNDYDLDMVGLLRNEDYSKWNSQCEECQIPMMGKGKNGKVAWEIMADEVVYNSLAESNADNADNASQPDGETPANNADSPTVN